MPIFKYKVLDANGNQITGELDAKDQNFVATYLQGQGLRVLSIDEKVNIFGELTSSGAPKVSLKQRVILSKQMATMLGAGLPITQVIEIIIQQTKDEALKKNLGQVLEEVQKNGTALSDAFERHTKIFNEVQINLFRAGEESGNLFEVLQKVAFDLEKSKILVGKIRSAMIYPIIIFVVVIGVMAVMMIYMVPAVQGLYADFGVPPEDLPWITKFLVGLSDFVTSVGGAGAIIVTVLAVIGGYRYLRSTKGGRELTDKILLKLPVVGNLVTQIHLAEFCRLLSMLIKSGVPIIRSLEIVAAALPNVHYSSVLTDSLDDISNGVPLAVPLSRSKYYPPLITKMVSIGEETGKLDNVLQDMAKFFDDEVNEISENLNKLMEPMILVIVGGLVAFLAVGIYLPIYSIGNNI